MLKLLKLLKEETGARLLLGKKLLEIKVFRMIVVLEDSFHGVFIIGASLSVG